ncbi:MAG: alpha/beta hydrolase [Paracoccaceae bacterium]|nr:alpha/beta hydrolase [Paracoccaceae bacterium]
MEREAAPFHAGLADGPDGGHALWCTASDGVKIRIGVWPKGDRGTVLLFPGRTEYVEKYGRAAGDFAARGYAMIAVDWRGQGLAGRTIADRNVGHVDRFADFQKDVAAIMAAVGALDLPRQLYLVSHSMGGAIALRALHEGLAVKAAVFSAPMWGILMPPAMRSLAPAIGRVGRALGFGHRYAPTTGPNSYVATAAFDDNVLTTDPAMWAYMKAQVSEVPALALGGPSLTWLHEAMIECRTLAAMAAPAYPVVTQLGTRERVVDPRPVHARMADWPGGRLDMIEGAEHEIMMETPSRRAAFFDAAAALFAAHP